MNIIQIHFCANIINQNRHSSKMIDRTVKESLRLRSVQIDGNNAVGASRFKQIAHKARRNRFASQMFFILPAIRHQRTYCRNGSCRSALKSVNHNQLFHNVFIGRRRGRLKNKNIRTSNRNVFIGRRRGRLKNKNIRTSNRFGIANINLAVGKIVCRSFKNINSQLRGNIRS